MLVIRSLHAEISIVVAFSSHNVRTKEGVPGTVPSCFGAHLPQQEHCSLGHVVRAMRAAQNTHVTHSLYAVIARIQGITLLLLLEIRDEFVYLFLHFLSKL